jgi:hypothetical protein
LAHTDPTGSAWNLTAQGRLALEQGEYTQTAQERRCFHFLEANLPPGQPRRPPVFLNLRSDAAEPWAADESWGFDAGLLNDCLRQSAEWKQRHGFPLDVTEVLAIQPEGSPTANGPPQPPSWQRVVLDRPERLLAVLILAANPERQGAVMHGFAVRQNGWVLDSAEPVFTLTEGWPDLFPDLAGDLPPEQWRQAWRSWCQPRSIPAGEADSCRLERRGERLHVTAPPKLVERLRGARSDALKGQAWVLGGEGNIRPAVQLEVVEEAPPATGR